MKTYQIKRLSNKCCFYAGRLNSERGVAMKTLAAEAFGQGVNEAFPTKLINIKSCWVGSVNTG